MTKAIGSGIVWRRQGAPHTYVGTLFLSGDGIRLVGRDPTTGIELSLSIPLEEIEGVRAYAGNGAVQASVLDLRSGPIVVSGIGAERLASLRAPSRPRRAGQPAHGYAAPRRRR
jgi:hypothetical protein